MGRLEDLPTTAKRADALASAPPRLTPRVVTGVATTSSGKPCAFVTFTPIYGSLATHATAQVASFITDRLHLLESCRTLFNFKQKFHLHWESRYIVTSTTLALPKIALAILRLRNYSGGGFGETSKIMKMQGSGHCHSERSEESQRPCRVRFFTAIRMIVLTFGITYPLATI